jgi:transglutaminase-like putative cysteine protease
VTRPRKGASRRGPPGLPSIAVDPFLRETSIIDFGDPRVRALAAELRTGDPVETARRSYEWVRDRIVHTNERPSDAITCSASEVLREGTGFCYAKSHLLAALLRANGIPAALAYQRLRSGEGFALHGLVACQVPGTGWYLCDPRGNKPGIDAQFTPPEERLAFSGPDVVRVPGVFADPLPAVVEALRTHRTFEAISAHLPDWTG